MTMFGKPTKRQELSPAAENDREVAAIIASVRKPADLAAAEQEVETVRAEMAALFAERERHAKAIRDTVIHPLAADERNRLMARVEAINNEAAALRAREREASRIVSRLQVGYRGAVAKALHPLRRAQAERILAAVREIEVADTTLSAADDAISAIGGQPERVGPCIRLLPAIRDAAARVRDGA